MQPHQDQRLSRIETLWTQMFRASKPDEKPDEMARDLVLRYYGAVYRYILGIVRNEDMAMDLTQEFATRFLRGDFKKANPERGRFRDFLKVSLRNLVMDFYRKQKVQREKGPRPLPDESSIPGSPADQSASDEAFVSSFREEVLARTWEALAEAERASGKSYHSVLRFQIQHPEMAGAEMAERYRASWASRSPTRPCARRCTGPEPSSPTCCWRRFAALWASPTWTS